jgi:hypothetical protein
MNELAKERHDAAERILAISEEIVDLLEEAMGLVRHVGTPTEITRARGYWLANIRISLNEDHGFMGRGGCTMADTARELMAEEPDEEGEE